MIYHLRAIIPCKSFGRDTVSSGRTALIIGVLVAIILLNCMPDMAKGHAAQEIQLQYDYDSQLLSATFTHGGGPGHYIETVIVYRNDVKVLEETYTDQPENRVFTYEYEVAAVDNDILKVWCECSLGGTNDAEITVVGPREYMTLTLNPEPESVESGEEVYMTVNIYREDENTPIDGVGIVADADLGFIDEVSELGLGGYGFTYSAPNLDSEDIEVINISCSKNGYHPLYYELSFDLVLAADDSKTIVISLSPIFYNMDEGKKKTIEVEVRAGGSYLDVSDIDVDYSHGKLNKNRDGDGRYTLEYTANQVDGDKTAYIRVSASMIGYVGGSKEIQFKIRDTGEDESDNTEIGGGLDYNTIFIGSIIAIILIVIVVVVILIRRRKKTEEVQVVEVEEVYDIPPDQ
jgi:hypothetical protein